MLMNGGRSGYCPLKSRAPGRSGRKNGEGLLPLLLHPSGLREAYKSDVRKDDVD